MVHEKFSKFYGRPGEDFHLWCARIEAFLEGKSVLRTIRSDPLSGEVVGEQDRKDVVTARAVIIQGSGNQLLLLCSNVRQNYFAMWWRLQDRYAVSNTATRVQQQIKLARMSYTRDSMQY